MRPVKGIPTRSQLQPKFPHVSSKKPLKCLCSPHCTVKENCFQHFIPFRCSVCEYEAKFHGNVLWYLRSSGMLHKVDWYLVTEVSGQGCLETFVTNHQSALRNIPEERRSNLPEAWNPTNALWLQISHPNAAQTGNNSRCEATQRVMATSLTIMTKKTAILGHVVADSCTSFRSRSYQANTALNHKRLQWAL